MFPRGAAAFRLLIAMVFDAGAVPLHLFGFAQFQTESRLPPFLELLPARLDQDDVQLNRHHDLSSRMSMIFSENRCPLFGIML